MNILYVTSEASPFSKSGGLADVMFDLPQAMSNINGVNKVMIVTPAYKNTFQKFNGKLEKVYDFKLPDPFSILWVHVYRYYLNKVEVYLLDIPGIFDRDGFYGYDDDPFRFAAFTFAVRQFVIDQSNYGMHFDAIHCNDWQTGFVPLFLKLWDRNVKCVFTIHNPAYQGWLPPHQLYDAFRLPYWMYENGYLRLGNSVNFLKTGITYSDAVTTVSVNHAHELLSDDNAFSGLGWVLKIKGNRFFGITNGLSYAEFNPETDKFIPMQFNYSNYQEGKRKAREEVIKRFYVEDKKGTPMFTCVSRLTEQKGMDRLWAIGESMKIANARLVILGSGDYDSEGIIYKLQERYPDNVLFWRGYSNEMAHLLYAAGDFFVMPSRFEPCGLSQLMAMRYGNLPIVSDAGGLKDTVKNYDQFDGTGFTFYNWKDNEGLWEATCRALNVYYKKDELNPLIDNAMHYDSSWTKPASKYYEVYKRLSNN